MLQGRRQGVRLRQANCLGHADDTLRRRTAGQIHREPNKRASFGV